MLHHFALERLGRFGGQAKLLRLFPTSRARDFKRLRLYALEAATLVRTLPVVDLRISLHGIVEDEKAPMK